MNGTDRRDFLKYGATLPLALGSANAIAGQVRSSGSSAKTEEAPRRILFICNSLGFYKNYFFPKKRGDLETSDYLQSIKLREKTTVFENLYHPGMETSNHDSEKSFLTGAPNPESTGFVNSISLDQEIVKVAGGETRFPFLSFSIYDRGWGCSWNDRGSAIPPMHDEAKIFDLLFKPADLTAQKKQIANDQEVLDCLKRDLQQLKSSQDGSLQKQYRELIGQLEEKLKHDRFWLTTKKPKVDTRLSQDTKFAFSTKIRNLFELSKLAFRTDSTRVITISLDWIYGAINVPGASAGWHTLSHHGGRPETLKDLRCVELEIIKNFNQFLLDMEAIPAGDGSLLDQTTVVF